MKSGRVIIKISPGSCFDSPPSASTLSKVKDGYNDKRASYHKSTSSPTRPPPTPESPSLLIEMSDEDGEAKKARLNHRGGRGVLTRGSPRLSLLRHAVER